MTSTHQVYIVQVFLKDLHIDEAGNPKIYMR